jgi:hypothetical protein
MSGLQRHRVHDRGGSGRADREMGMRRRGLQIYYEWMESCGSWGRLAERPVVNARQLGALKARQFLSPGHRPGNGIVTESEPYRGGIPTVHGRRTPGIAPLQG